MERIIRGDSFILADEMDSEARSFIFYPVWKGNR
jgi:hypothetical protein